MQELERDGRQRVTSIRKSAAQQRQPLESAAGGVQSRIDKLQGELDDARQWLVAIPAEAEPSAVSQRLTVQTTWPARIQQQRDELARIRQQLADVQRRADRDIDAVRVDVDAAVLDVIKRLQTMPIDILR